MTGHEAMAKLARSLSVTGVIATQGLEDDDTVLDGMELVATFVRCASNKGFRHH